MDNLGDFLEKKDMFVDNLYENGKLDEDAASAVALVLGIPTVSMVAAYGGAQLLFALSKGLKGILRSWKVAIKEFKSISDVNETDFTRYLSYVKKDPVINKMYNDEKQHIREYSDILKDVYDAIDEKSFTKTNNKANEEFLKLPKNLQNSPDIKRAVINAIIKTTGEPPIWPPSPGNTTYQSIKYVIGIREAKAQAAAFKYNAVRTMEKIENND